MEGWDNHGSDNVTSGRIGVEQLFREHAGFVASFLHRLGVPEADVDDAVQEVFTVAHRKGGFEPGQATPRTWLGAIATRVASTQRRTRSRKREHFEESGIASPTGSAPSAHQTLEVRQALDRVGRALSCLDVQHRAAFVLFELEGEDCNDIAQSLGVPIGTVHSRLHTARRRFAHAYEAELAAEARVSGERDSAADWGAVR